VCVVCQTVAALVVSTSWILLSTVVVQATFGRLAAGLTRWSWKNWCDWYWWDVNWSLGGILDSLIYCCSLLSVSCLLISLLRVTCSMCGYWMTRFVLCCWFVLIYDFIFSVALEQFFSYLLLMDIK